MGNAFEDALVTGWEPLEATVVLPDVDDRHVVAAAMRGRADAIVTANVRHFPAEILEPIGIEVLHTNDFLLDQLDLAPRVVLEVLREQAAHTATRRWHLSTWSHVSVEPAFRGSPTRLGV